MSESVNAGNESSRADGAKWTVVAALVVVGVVGNAHYAGQFLVYRVLALVLLGAAAAWLALQTSQGVAFQGLARDSWKEVHKVVWPTHQETTQTTLVVAAVVLVMALILWALDALLGWLAALLIG